jgi:hypothetical protein
MSGLSLTIFPKAIPRDFEDGYVTSYRGNIGSFNQTLQMADRQLYNRWMSLGLPLYVSRRDVDLGCGLDYKIILIK